MFIFFFFKQKTAYEMHISDWSSDVCSSDLAALLALGIVPATFLAGQVPGVTGHTAVYAAVVVLLAAAQAALTFAIDQRWLGMGTITGVAATVVLIALDVAFGAALQVNAVFGYSLAVAGRFAGIGNLAFSPFGGIGRASCRERVWQ